MQRLLAAFVLVMMSLALLAVMYVFIPWVLAGIMAVMLVGGWTLIVYEVLELYWEE